MSEEPDKPTEGEGTPSDPEDPYLDMEGHVEVCRCGHGRTHRMVSPACKYSGWGWFWNLVGVTTRPIRVVYQCRVCEQTLGETTNPDILAAHT